MFANTIVSTLGKSFEGVTKETHGGKGYGLCEMAALGLPVPPAIVVPVSAVNDPKVAAEDLCGHLNLLQLVRDHIGPLGSIQVSVRSGAPVSMPGMMETVLNIGTQRPIEGSSAARQDQYKRLVTMFGTIVNGHDAELYKACMTWEQAETVWKEQEGKALFPEAPEQLQEAVAAVRLSFDNERSREYRRRFNVQCAGTGIVIQRMVFGNSGEGFNCTGVAFSHDMNTGRRVLTGEFLCNAQGEDVVSGEVTGRPIHKLPVEHYRTLQRTVDTLVEHFDDAQDVEFTIENGVFYMLQTRSAKRSGLAAISIMNELETKPSVLAVQPAHLDQLMQSTLRFKGMPLPMCTGIAAVPGAGMGRVCFSTDEVVVAAESGETDLVLLAKETSAEDIKAFSLVKALVTRRGGMASHAAVVARGMGLPCVCGIGDEALTDCPDHIAVDGTGGCIYGVEDVEGLTEADPSQHAAWSDFLSYLADFATVYANADTNEDIRKAYEMGACGVGLVRTEHMFTTDAHLAALRRLFSVFSGGAGGAGGSGGADSDEDACAEIQKLQTDDFYALLKDLPHIPVTIRLLDPPLHEFVGADAEHTETNPMMGVRGVRLGLLTGVFAAQARGLRNAVSRLIGEGRAYGKPRVMIPLTTTRAEYEACVATFKEELNSGHVNFDIGTMIETPAAVLNAKDIYASPDCAFLSLGTNDLTQMTLGMSRDDTTELLAHYEETGIVEANPFKTLHPTVSAFIKKYVPGEAGICGEHGGDYDTIQTLVDHVAYYSCSVKRIPYAMLADTHAMFR